MDTQRSDAALADRVFESVLGAFDIYAIYVGDRLGYYRALGELGALTSAELAEAAGTRERYAREWLEQQTVTGILDLVDDGPPRRFGLPPGHAVALTDETSPSYVAPFARMVATAGRQARAIAERHRTGGGVSWDEFGDDMRESQGDMNRPFFHHELGPGMAAVPELADRLVPGTRVADVGCGHGWSTIAIAQHFPGVEVHGYDIDEPSVAAANRHAEEAGVADRVTFSTSDVTTVDESYDVVTAFECIHDMAQPVPVLAAMHRLAGDDGYVMVMDERVADAFDPDAGPVESLMYGFSNFICLPDGLSTPGSVGTGTVMRPERLLEYAREAGFESLEVLPIAADFWRFYHLT